MIWLPFGLICILLSILGSPQGLFKDNALIRSIAVSLLVVALSYMTGMGGQLSTDHEAYVNIYRHVESTSFSHFLDTFKLRGLSFKSEEYRYEFGFIIFCFVCKWLGLGVAGYFLLASLITNVFAIKTLYRFKYPAFCILIFITSRAFLQEANIVRQTMAISIFAYALKYIESRDFKRYALWVLLASTLHTSIFLTLPLYLLVFVKNEKHERLCFFGLLGLWLLSLFFAHSNLFLNINLDATTYSQLMEDSEFEHFKELTINYRYNIFIALLFFFYYYHRTISKHNPFGFNPYLVCTVLGAVFCNLSVNVFYLYRISLIFDIIYCFYLGTALQGMRFSQDNNKYSLLFIAIFAFKLVTFIKNCLADNEVIGASFYSISDIFLS